MPIKKILLRILIIAVIIFIPVFIISSIYVIKVYAEYYANKEQIFETINASLPWSPKNSREPAKL